MPKSLDTHWEKLRSLPRPALSALFAQDPARLAKLSARLQLGDEGGIQFDWSKTHLDDAHLAGFAELAEAADFAGRRAALFAGAVVKASEPRSAYHPAHRGAGRPRRARAAPVAGAAGGALVRKN